MNEIDRRLEEREAAGTPILVGLIGAGQMGSEIVSTVGEMAGMEIPVVVDIDKQRAIRSFDQSKKKKEIVQTDDPKEARKAVTSGKYAAASDYRVITEMPEIDAVIDATGSTEMGAVITLDAVNRRKHVVMMSVECDVTIGPILRQYAENAGVVYSLAAGDEPAAIMELYRFARSIGFEVVAAGKGKNNPLDIYATPDDVKAKADERQMSAKMLCEFVDGSKTAIEMASVSNATGLLPDVRGMHGAKASVDTLNSVFIPKDAGGVLDGKGIVDFAIGVHPGVFLIVTTDNPRLREGLSQRSMGDGPYYTLFRPYHLCSIEVPLTVAQAVFYGESSGHPGKFLSSECIAVAKRDLKRGEILDGIGEYCYRGSIERADIARESGFLPLGLAVGSELTRDVPKDETITREAVRFPRESVLLNLRRVQDQLYLKEK